LYPHSLDEDPLKTGIGDQNVAVCQNICFISIIYDNCSLVKILNRSKVIVCFEKKSSKKENVLRCTDGGHFDFCMRIRTRIRISVWIRSNNSNEKIDFLTGNDKSQSVEITRGTGGQYQTYWIRQQQQLKSPGYPDSACGSCCALEQPTAEAVPRPSAGLRDALERSRLRRGEDLGREIQPGGAGVAAGRVANPHSFDPDRDPAF
jgi:hypothetical protein